MGYILSAFADEAADDLREQIGACKKNGVGFIEIRGVNGKNIGAITADEAKEIKKVLDESGMGVSAIGSPYGKIGILDDFALHLEAYKRTIEVAHILGTKYIRLFSFYIPEGGIRADYRQEVIERVGMLAEHADGIVPCHENEGGIYGEDAEHCHDLALALNGKLKLVFDPANFIFAGVKTRPAYELLKPFTEYFHIKDCISNERKTVPAGCGDGEIPWILDDFATAERDVFLTVEPHLASFTGLNALSQPNEGNELQFTYRSRMEAFEAAVKAIQEIINNLTK
jgi:sugar phosphate isomerase/epimerase